MELIHLRILLALKRHGTLSAAARTLSLTQSALSHQIKNLEKRLGVALWHKQGRLLVLTQAGRYLSEVAESVVATVDSAQSHLAQVAAGKAGKLTIGIECHACYEWFRGILRPFLRAWPELGIEVTSRYRFDSLAAIRQYQLDAVLTSDPVGNGLLSYQPLFEFELVLIVANDHPLAGRTEVAAADLGGETVLTYPVARDRLDIFRKVLQPAGIEPAAHVQVEETDIMLQLAAAGRGVCLLPEWLLADKPARLGLTGLRFADLAIGKTMYLACRHEDAELACLRWLVAHSAKALAKRGIED